jgi:hypothetical protein
LAPTGGGAPPRPAALSLSLPLSLFLPSLPLGCRLQPLLHSPVPLAVKLCFLSVDSGQGDQAELDWRRGGALGLGGCRLGARFGVQRSLQGQRFVVACGLTVSLSCGCRDLWRLKLPASTAVRLEVYVAAEGQRPLGGSASSSGGSCGGGAGRPGYRRYELGLVRPLFPARSVVPAASSAPSWLQARSRASGRRRAWWLADSSFAVSSSRTTLLLVVDLRWRFPVRWLRSAAAASGAGHGSQKRGGEAACSSRASAPATTSSTPVSSQRHLTGARHTQAPSPGEGGRLRGRERGKSGDHLSARGQWFCRQNHTRGHNQGRGVALTIFLGVEIFLY